MTKKEIDDGGQAFPRPISEADIQTKHIVCNPQAGMTLRQWYAGMALQLSKAKHCYTSQVVEGCFELADAMIAHEKRWRDNEAEKA